jgi:uncharacterized membrane protein
MVNKIVISVLVCLILLSCSAIAQDSQTNVVLTLKDANTNDDVSDVAVYLNLNDIELNYYVSDVIRLKLDDGDYQAVIRVDDLSTPGNDYFKKADLTVDNSLIEGIFLYPVGTLRGIVKDKLDNIVGDAELKFECTPNPEIDFPAKTDKFGGFYVNYVPVGKCKIFAIYKSAIGVKEVNITQGVLEDVEINLDKSILVKEKNILFDALIILASVLIAAFLIAVYFKRKTVHGIEKKKEKKEEPGKRAKDIAQTLNEKEKTVVNYLLEHEYKGTKHIGIQSEIRRETGIPRTSLARIIKSLQIKKIIQVEKMGKAIKLKLTDWFLGKD